MTTLRSAGFDASSTVEEVAIATGMEPREVLLQTRLREVDDCVKEVLDRPFDFPDDFDIDTGLRTDDVDGVRGREDFSLGCGRTSTGATGMMRFAMGATTIVRPRDLIETPTATWQAKIEATTNDPVARRTVLSDLAADVRRDMAKRKDAMDGKVDGVTPGRSPHEAALEASAKEKAGLLRQTVYAQTPAALHGYLDRGSVLPMTADPEGIQFEGYEKFTAIDDGHVYTYFVPSDGRDTPQKKTGMNPNEGTLPAFHMSDRKGTFAVEHVYNKGLPKGHASKIVAEQLEHLFDPAKLDKVMIPLVANKDTDQRFAEGGRSALEIFPETTLGRMTIAALGQFGRTIESVSTRTASRGGDIGIDIGLA